MPPFRTNEGFSLSLLDTYVFLVLFACVCHGVHRQTNRHSREISEIVPAHTRVRTHAEITRTPLSCGGDECDADSLSLLMQSYIPTCILVCLCRHIFVIHFPLSIPDSWWPNSLFLLDTGILICPTTSCRPCHPAFLPGFHRLGVCVFVVAEYCDTVLE